MGDRCFCLSLNTHFPIAKTKAFGNLSLSKNQGPKSFSTVRFGSFRTQATVSDHRQLTFYELLGISESVGLMEIKQAYKQMARKYHPDVSPVDQVEEYTRIFIQVHEAYETLSDPRSKALYDQELARGFQFPFPTKMRFDEEPKSVRNMIDLLRGKINLSTHFKIRGLERSGWRNCWQDQVAELKRRSMHKNSGENVSSGENMSWAARMRMEREQQSEE
ncbi:DNAJ-like 20 isoform X1 [Tasmannia lanceolata]|uniref:DNAJ-like 20 isoform X1 n=1 Tax=Tasmannia lanceolata TaxID=3420 RepID=UPI004062DD0B